MQFPAVDPLICFIPHVLRLDLRAPAQSPNPTPAHGRYSAEPRCPEAGVSDQDRANIVRNQCPQLLQEASFCTRRSLLLSWHYHVQQGKRAAAHRHRCAQQTPRFVWLQIAPVDDDYRLRAAQQPVRHLVVDHRSLNLQIAITQQAINCLERRAHPQCARPRTCDVLSVSLRPCNNASTACSNVRSRNACIPDSELGRHFCNTSLARMVVNLLWLSHLEDCAMRALSSRRLCRK